MNASSASFEILEHTADVGIRALGSTMEEAFEQAAWGLADILGIRRPGEGGRPRTVVAGGDDAGATLVELLNELLLLHETGEIGFANVRVLRATETEAEAVVDVVPLAGEPVGTPVKAATYHQLGVRQLPGGGVEAVVYLDV